MQQALEYGIRAFDTSPYNGPSEEILGAALDTLSEALDLATAPGSESRSIECIVRAMLGRLRYERGDLAAAREEAERAIDLARQLAERDPELGVLYGFTSAAAAGSGV